jgi:CBS domain-containing membrane protein/CBS domain-containing protein
MYTVYDLMTRDVVVLGEDDDLSETERLLNLRHLRRLPVVSKEGRPLGLITQRELLQACRYAPGTPARARDFMKKEIFTVGPRTSLREAIGLMLARKVGCLPVVNDEGLLVGILTDSDFLRFADSRVEELDRRDLAQEYEADA